MVKRLLIDEFNAKDKRILLTIISKGYIILMLEGVTFQFGTKVVITDIIPALVAN